MIHDAALCFRVLPLQRRRGLSPHDDAPPSVECWVDECTRRASDEEVVARERTAVADDLAQVPQGTDELIAWFDGLPESRIGRRDAPSSWLTADASLDDMCWFLDQQQACNDALRLLSDASRLQCPAASARATQDALPEHEEAQESPSVVRLWSALGRSRRYALQSQGALSVFALTSPARALGVSSGLRRLGWPQGREHLVRLGATHDAWQARAWNEDMLRPLMAANPRCGHAFAEGALMCLSAGARALATYRAQSATSTTGSRATGGGHRG